MIYVNTAEYAARLLLRASPDLYFDKETLDSRPEWSFGNVRGPLAFYRACEATLKADRFSPIEHWVTSADTRKDVREAAERIVTTFSRSSI